MNEKDENAGVPDYGGSSGYAKDAPQSGMVQDEDAAPKTPHRPPTGGGSENGSNPGPASPSATTDTNPNA